tara:strand:+ start:466 stop:1293 length:828 start_codon:yes stop_codon:yes gene_type:complete
MIATDNPSKRLTAQARRRPLVGGTRDGDLPFLVQLADSNLYTLSTYSGCEFRCSYCCTNAQGPSIPIANVPQRLVSELERVPRDAEICLGALIDAYPSVEHELGATRAALEVLVADRRSVRVVTKGDAVLRDIDLFSQLPWHEIVVSVCSLDQQILDRCDGNSPQAIRRLEVIQELADAGLNVQCNIAPWMPGSSDIEAILAQLPASARVLVAPPILGRRGERTIAGQRLRRQPVVEAYMEEYRRLGHHERIDFLAPIKPPLENFAAHLPRRPAG